MSAVGVPGVEVRAAGGEDVLTKEALAFVERVGEAALTHFDIPGAAVTEQGLRTNVSVGVRYIDSWLRGVGAAAIDNLMEDAATAEISRSQVWQWVRAGLFTPERVREELEPLRGEYPDAVELFEETALTDELVEFLTLPAYDRLQ